MIKILEDWEPRRSKPATISLWALQVLLASTFCAVGSSNLVGFPVLEGAWEEIGFGQWCRSLTGAIELIAGLYLLIPFWSGVGALVLTVVMYCSSLAHVTIIEGNPTPAIVLLFITAFITWVRREDIGFSVAYGNLELNDTK